MSKLMYGPLAPSFKSQLIQLNFKLKRKAISKLRFLDSLNEWISWLYCQQILTKSESRNAFKRLHSRVMDCVEKTPEEVKRD